MVRFITCSHYCHNHSEHPLFLVVGVPVIIYVTTLEIAVSMWRFIVNVLVQLVITALDATMGGHVNSVQMVRVTCSTLPTEVRQVNVREFAVRPQTSVCQGKNLLTVLRFHPEFALESQLF